MKRLKVLALMMGLCFSLSAVPAEAQSIWAPCDSTSSNSAICADPEGEEATGIVKRLIDVFLFLIGVISVIMIIHSGLKYTTSRGDAEQVKSAKNTLLYSVVGLIVAMLAFVIVNFVIGAFNQSGSGGTGQETENTEQPVSGGGGPNQ